jgi:MFS transporter, putative metabolite:H+ symporter
MAPPTVNAGPRIDRLPIAGFHRRVLWLIGGGMFFDSFDIYLTGGVLGALVTSGWSDLHLNARFISATFIGMVIGAWSAGILGDRFGRRFSYQLNLAIFGLASLAAAAAPSMNWLIGLRFIMGIGLGAEIVVGYATLTEFVPPASRGRWAALLSLITNSALFVSALVGYLVIPRYGWRWMFLIVGVGTLIIWYLRKALPESPRWLEGKGRVAEAEELLRRIEGEVQAEHELPSVGPAVSHAPEPSSIATVFSRAMIARTLVGVTLSVVIGLVVYGFVVWVPTFFVKQGVSIARSLGFTTLMSLGGPVGALFGMWCADWMGRKGGIVVVSIIAAGLGALYPFMTLPALVTTVGFLLFTMIYLLVALAVAAYIPELYPTEIRLRGTGVCNTAGRITTIFVPYVIVAVYESGQVVGVVTLLSIALLVQAAVVGFIGIETKQRSLESLVPST